jgi:hypothetical protein
MSNAIPNFVDLLDNWSYHYPLPSQWAVEIPLPSGISQSLEGDIQELEHPEWEINTAFSELTKHEVLKKDTIHCFFVDSVQLQPENAGASSTSIGGLIPGLYSTGRADFASRALSITFRETAHSFADFVIRPWIILAAHLGRIADRNNDIKTNITVYSYGKSRGSSKLPTIRKIHRYYGCIPAKVSALDLKYDDGSIMTYSTEWYFDRYSVSSSPSGRAGRRSQAPRDALDQGNTSDSPGMREYYDSSTSMRQTPAEEASTAESVRSLREELSNEPGGEWLKK